MRGCVVVRDYAVSILVERSERGAVRLKSNQTVEAWLAARPKKERGRMLDILGGMVVLREAGGAILTADGQPVTEQTRTLIAGSPDLCRQFVELMIDYDLEGWTADQAHPPVG